jgi:P2-related tail formation protein
MTAQRSTLALIPPSIFDARGRAFGNVIEQAMLEPDFKQFLIERIDSVDARLLPSLIREFGLHKFVEVDMSEPTLRAMLKGSFDLHKEIGTIRGVRFGLGLIGLSIKNWVQWFEESPKATSGTHRVRLVMERAIFPEGSSITARLIRTIERMVRHTQRASQHITLLIETKSDAVPVHVGAVFITKARFKMASTKRTNMGAQALIYSGAVFTTRLKFKMGV